MNEKKKYIITVIVLTAAFVIFGKFLFISVSPMSVPTLFINDRKFEYEYNYPLEVRDDGILYVPEIFFTSFGNLKGEHVESYPSRFYLQYKDRFISFDMDTGTAQTNSWRGKLNVYIIHNTYYVPAVFTANMLGIMSEVDKDYGVFRIYNPLIAKKTVTELISEYLDPTTTVPPYFPTETVPTEPPPELMPTISPTEPVITEPPVITTAPPDIPAAETSETEPVTTEEPTTAEDMSPRENYYFFENANHLNEIEKVIEILAEYGVTSTFFMTADEIINSPDIVSYIYVKGHNIGIRLSDNEAKEYESVRNELDYAGNFVYAIIKTKPRLWLLNDNFAGDKFKKEVFGYNLKDSGYYLCHYNISVYNHEALPSENSEELIEFMKKYEKNYFLFNINGDVYESLRRILKGASLKSYISNGYPHITNLK